MYIKIKHEHFTKLLLTLFYKLSFQCILPLWINGSFMKFLWCFNTLFMLCKGTADSSCLLRSQVKGLVFLVLIQLSQIFFLLLVHYYVHTSNSLANNTAEIKTNYFFTYINLNRALTS
jgi:hypothetical protein